MTDKVDVNADVINPRLLVFPQDATGFMYKAKNEVLKAVERQNGNPEKHDVLIGSLIVLLKFAKRRYAVQAETRAAAIAAIAAAAQAVEVPAEPEQATGGAPIEPAAPVQGPAKPTENTLIANAITGKTDAA